MNYIDKLKNPPAKYRPMPFWSWNSKLEVPETTEQVDKMHDIGNGGFFMHARGGLKTEYMSDEWFDNIKSAVSEAKKLGINPWGYDENGWPSGFGSDAVNGLGIDYQQKYLRLEITDKPAETQRTIANTKAPNGKNAHFYYDVNPFYIDTLDPKVTDEFIRVTHERYKKELGENFTDMTGFFTDEPQISRNGIPWSFTLCDEYEKAYGEKLIPVLYDLFEDTETSVTTRFRFWKLVTKLFSENFLGRIYDWCNKNDSHLTGHMVCEESFNSQLDSNGACMPNYEYFHIPGVDKLGRGVGRDLLAPQVTSVAAQLGKKQILTESFAMCGWDVSFEELKWILEWQMVKGVNLLCQHLAGYSLGGIRKRDYPAGHFYQNPWWDEYKDFVDFSARMGMLLSDGELKCDVLVLHTMSSAWIERKNDGYQQKIEEHNKRLMEISVLLDKNQIIHHLGDDKIMSKYANVKDGLLNVGKMSYGTVIVPGSRIIDANTFRLIEEFAKSGGNLIFVGQIPEYIDGIASEKVKELAEKCTHIDNFNEVLAHIPKSAKYCSVTDKNGNNADIQFAYRNHGDFEMYYFVNTYSPKCENIRLSMTGKSVCEFDYITGTEKPCIFENDGENIIVHHTFEEKGSYVLFVRRDGKYKSAKADNKALSSINGKLRGEWKIKEHDRNLLTLDRCDCYFDGKLCGKNMYVGDIQEKACAFGKKVGVKLDFHVNVKKAPEGQLFLILEQPENYTLYINGSEVSKNICGYYRDKSFIKLDISGKLISGENTVTLMCDFVQPESVYSQLEDCLKFESMKNKLWYDMEIESVYLLGNFGVGFDKDFRPAAHDSLVNDGTPYIDEMPAALSDGDFTEQGLPFFCGHIKVSKEIELSESEINSANIELARLCSTVSWFTVNGKKLENIYWAPYNADLTGLLHAGKNTIELDIVGNFRNMLGPHHTDGENYCVGPGSFMHESPIFGHGNWYDGYCFVKYGLFLK